MAASNSFSDEGELLDERKKYDENVHFEDENEIDSSSGDEYVNEEGAEDSLNIKPPQASKLSSHQIKYHTNKHKHSSQISKRDKHSKKGRRSKDHHHKSSRQSEQNSKQLLTDPRMRDQSGTRKHRHRDEHRRDKEMNIRDHRISKDLVNIKDAREILTKRKEERNFRDGKDWPREKRDEHERMKEERNSYRERKENERETAEREKRRDRLMLAERDRAQRTYRRPDDVESQSSSRSYKKKGAESSKIKYDGEYKSRRERSRSPMSKIKNKNRLNEHLKEKLKEIKSEADNEEVQNLQEDDISEDDMEVGEKSPPEESVITINDDDITSDEKQSSRSISEKEEGEHTDDEEEVIFSGSESSSSSEGESAGEDGSSSEDDSESEGISETGVSEAVNNQEESDIKSDLPNNDFGSKIPKNEDILAENVEDSDDNESELPSYYPAIQGCRSVEEFNCLNRIEEGTFGVVYRARDKKRNEIVALKRLKMENEKEGFPITSLREINTLLKAQHVNIVTCREIVVGSNMDKIYIVMDYVEHDLKSLMEGMKQPFLIGEVKTLIIQLLRAVAHLHDNWILHRDLKTSNLLLSHKGILKVGDFGLAREYGSPLKPYTPIVVTLWYRAPELLLGTKQYSCPIDLWSVGCIMGEFLTLKPLFPGKSEGDQLAKLCNALGTPNDTIWPGFSELPLVKKIVLPHVQYNTLRGKFGSSLDDSGFALLMKFLTYNPKKRVTAEEGLNQDWFNVAPKPVSPSLFPTWPAKSEQVHHRRTAQSPKPPSGGKEFKLLEEADEDPQTTSSDSNVFHMNFARGGSASKGYGFTLKF
ncbi:Cyclin-dependent kinase 11B [Nymphon striatum]|nr:Cyclin-dependent kinase 11B [Nymphon striatum]